MDKKTYQAGTFFTLYISPWQDTSYNLEDIQLSCRCSSVFEEKAAITASTKLAKKYKANDSVGGNQKKLRLMLMQGKTGWESVVFNNLSSLQLSTVKNEHVINLEKFSLFEKSLHKITQDERQIRQSYDHPNFFNTIAGIIYYSAENDYIKSPNLVALVKDLVNITHDINKTQEHPNHNNLYDISFKAGTENGFSFMAEKKQNDQIEIAFIGDMSIFELENQKLRAKKASDKFIL